MADPIRPYKAIIFDLDGTLLNTEEGVLSSVRHAITVMGYPALSDEVMRTFIGPPVKIALMNTYHLEETEAAKATEVFRNQYKNHDLLKAIPYDGMMALLADLKAQGYLIGVATLKRDDYAHTILEHFQMDLFCDSICGSDFESKMRKKDVLLQCMKELGVSKEEALLIGDTASDGQGAEAANVDFLAVTYGFGHKTKAEWSPFHPIFTAHSVEHIREFLISQ